MNGEVLEVYWINYLRVIQTIVDGASVYEEKKRLGQAHSTIIRPAILWKNKAISFPTKMIN